MILDFRGQATSPMRLFCTVSLLSTEI